MLIPTKDYDMVEIDPKDIIKFPRGIFAFEDVHEFVLLNPGNKSPVMKLQAVGCEDPRFIVMDPFAIVPCYHPTVTRELLDQLQAKTKEDIKYFVIAVIPGNIKKTTVNLKSPVAINFETRLGMQIILDADDYPIRFPLFDAGGREAGLC